jgi:hypothetical protein
MRDIWYGDQRDLVKWGALLHLAHDIEAVRILQVAYYRTSNFGRLIIDGQERDIPEEAIAHFRNLRTIGGLDSKLRITVFDPIFQDRVAHQRALLALLSSFEQERYILLLDPDTGLEPANPSLEHVLETEVREIWPSLKRFDMLALYQHQTNMAGKPWVEPKRSQLANALRVPIEAIKIASAPKVARDVVLFYLQKS